MTSTVTAPPAPQVAEERLPSAMKTAAANARATPALRIRHLWHRYGNLETVANLSSISDDRSSGLRLWFVVSTPLLAGMLMLPGTQEPGTRLPLLLAGILALEWFPVMMAFVFASEPLGPARRLVHRWRFLGTPRWRRFLGKSMTRAAMTHVGVGALCIGMQVGIAFASVRNVPSAPPETSAALVVAACHALALTVLTVGVVAWLRTRSHSALVPRLVLGGMLFVLVVGPWELMAITGWTDDSHHYDELLVAAPSPGYFLLVFEALHHGTADPERRLRVIAGVASIAAWLLAGLGFLLAAMRRSRRLLQEHAARLDTLESALDTETR